MSEDFDLRAEMAKLLAGAAESSSREKALALGNHDRPVVGQWYRGGEGRPDKENRDGFDGKPYKSSFMVHHSDHVPELEPGNAMYRLNLDKHSMNDDIQSAAELIGGHVGSKALPAVDAENDAWKTSLALDPVQTKLGRLRRARALNLEKIRYDDAGDMLPTKHSVFVKVERNPDATHFAVPEDQHDLAARNFAQHQKMMSDADAAYVTRPDGGGEFKDGYVASHVSPELMKDESANGARLRSIETHNYQKATGDSFDKYMARTNPIKAATYNQARQEHEARAAHFSNGGWQHANLVAPVVAPQAVGAPPQQAVA